VRKQVCLLPKVHDTRRTFVVDPVASVDLFTLQEFQGAVCNLVEASNVTLNSNRVKERIVEDALALVQIVFERTVVLNEVLLVDSWLVVSLAASNAAAILQETNSRLESTRDSLSTTGFYAFGNLLHFGKIVASIGGIARSEMHPTILISILQR
jgi:hypothetical protein